MTTHSAQNWIDGAFATSTKRRLSINPATDETIGDYPDDGGGAALLVDSSDVPTISFTVNTRTSAAIGAVGARRTKRFGLELGGKAPMIVFGDADIATVSGLGRLNGNAALDDFIEYKHIALNPGLVGPTVLPPLPTLST